jgi:hypothetical protein
MLHQEPDGPFLRYRARWRAREVWAKQMPDAFEIREVRDLIDHRRAGTERIVKYVNVLEGRAGDYLVLLDASTETRAVFGQAAFEEAFMAVSSLTVRESLRPPAPAEGSR